MADNGDNGEERSRAERQADRDPLGARMKEYEKAFRMYIDGSMPYIARLDGHTFSKFTKGLVKPYDERLGEAMVNTSRDLLAKFGAMTAFTQSDEITLVFRPVHEDTGETLMFGGKVVKMATLMAGYCSARFNYYISQFDWSDRRDNVQERMTAFEAHFDCRIFNVPDMEDMVLNLIWRSDFDCRRNSVAMLAQAHFSNKVLHGKNTRAMLEMLEEAGHPWIEMPGHFKHGSFSKKEQYEMDAVNQKTGEAVTAIRTRVVTRSFRFYGFSQAKSELLLAKYWPEDEAFLGGADGTGVRTTRPTWDEGDEPDA